MVELGKDLGMTLRPWLTASTIKDAIEDMSGYFIEILYSNKMAPIFWFSNHTYNSPRKLLSLIRKLNYMFMREQNL